MYYVIFGLLGAALLGADQWVKAWVMGHLQMGETTSLFPGFLELMRVHNYGAAWSSFCRADGGCCWVFTGGACWRWWLLAAGSEDRPAPAGRSCACCLILSGGIGNIIDRFRLRLRGGYAPTSSSGPAIPAFNRGGRAAWWSGSYSGRDILLCSSTKNMTGGRTDGSTLIRANGSCEDAGTRLDSMAGPASRRSLTRSAVRKAAGGGPGHLWRRRPLAKSYRHRPAGKSGVCGRCRSRRPVDIVPAEYPAGRGVRGRGRHRGEQARRAWWSTRHRATRTARW